VLEERRRWAWDYADAVDVAAQAHDVLARLEDPLVPLLELARQAAESGATQEELVAVFGRLRRGASEAQEDRVLEVLDAITGHCHLSWRIFP
jgi:hypothetical protein